MIFNIQNKKNTKNLINFFARNFSWVSILFFIFLVYISYIFCCFLSLLLFFPNISTIYILHVYLSSFGHMSLSFRLFWVSFFFGLLSFISFYSHYYCYHYGFKAINIDFPSKYGLSRFIFWWTIKSCLGATERERERKNKSINFSLCFVFIVLFCSFLFLSFSVDFYLSFYF